MLERSVIEEQLENTLQSVELPEFGTKIEGKVRDCYVVGDKRIIISTDRLSAFDVVLTTIPFKGQLLNQMAAYWFDATKHIIPNHIIDQPHPNVLVTKEVQILPVEVVVRGYLTGSAWRDYQAGRPVSGITLPPGLQKSARLDLPLITPSTKAERGTHDLPISSEEIVSSGLVPADIWAQVSETALKLFAFGTAKAKEHGLILVDTKYEFGTLRREDGSLQLILADEIHTPDSSRYWISDTYQTLFQKGEDPEMLDKEFVRRWLIEQGYMGEGTPPPFTDSFRIDTAIRYIEAFERVTGQKFQAKSGRIKEEIQNALKGLRP